MAQTVQKLMEEIQQLEKDIEDENEVLKSLMSQKTKIEEKLKTLDDEKMKLSEEICINIDQQLEALDRKDSKLIVYQTTMSKILEMTSPLVQDSDEVGPSLPKIAKLALQTQKEKDSTGLEENKSKDQKPI